MYFEQCIVILLKYITTIWSAEAADRTCLGSIIVMSSPSERFLCLENYSHHIALLSSCSDGPENPVNSLEPLISLGAESPPSPWFICRHHHSLLDHQATLDLYGVVLLERRQGSDRSPR